MSISNVRNVLTNVYPYTDKVEQVQKKGRCR